MKALIVIMRVVQHRADEKNFEKTLFLENNGHENAREKYVFCITEYKIIHFFFHSRYVCTSFKLYTLFIFFFIINENNRFIDSLHLGPIVFLIRGFYCKYIIYSILIYNIYRI